MVHRRDAEDAENAQRNSAVIRGSCLLGYCPIETRRQGSNMKRQHSLYLTLTIILIVSGRGRAQSNENKVEVGTQVTSLTLFRPDGYGDATVPKSCPYSFLSVTHPVLRFLT